VSFLSGDFRSRVNSSASTSSAPFRNPSYACSTTLVALVFGMSHRVDIGVSTIPTWRAMTSVCRLRSSSRNELLADHIAAFDAA
jgi:hypothetical protein